MITDMDCVQACSDVYPPDDGKGFPITREPFNEFWTIGNVYVGLRHIGDFDLLVFRGSVSELDWVRDFEGWPRKHPLLGYCHNGFLDSMDDVYDHVLLGLKPERSFAITGHSLGAARALIAAGIFTARGRPPALVVTFGTPRPGMAQLSKILSAGGFPIRHYRNGDDPVAGVPVTLPPLLMYCKPSDDIELHAQPERCPEDPFRWHKIGLYVEGMKNLIAANAATGVGGAQ